MRIDDAVVADAGGRDLDGSRSRKRWRGRGLYLGLLGALFGALSLTATFVVVVDPYNLYPWGPRPQLSRDSYDSNALPSLLNVVAKGGYDTLLIGGSSAQQFETADIERELRGTRRAFAFTYSSPKPQDLEVVMTRTATAPGLRRVLLSYDLSYLSPLSASRKSFPFALYDTDPLNDLRGFGVEAVLLSARLLAGGEYYLSSWDARPELADWRGKYEQSLTPRSIASIRRTIEAHRAAVDEPTTLRCDDFPAIGTIARYADALGARGVQLDVVVPPYSYAMYFDYLQPEKRHRVNGGPALATMLLTRRCLLEVVAGKPNVRVFSFDLERSLVEDMANYRDPVHLYGAATGRRMLRDIDKGANELTLAGFDAHADELRRRVRRYTYFNSRAR